MRRVLIALALILLTASLAEAGTISRPTKTFGGTTFINGVVPDESDFNGDIDTAYSEINGRLSNVNISSSAAIAGSKITPAFTAESSTTVSGYACHYINESDQSANQRRWYLCSQGGGFGITSRDDSGVVQATPVSINRSTGVVTFGASTAPVWTGACTFAQGCTGLASGTSGGILGFTGATTLASSGALVANAMVYGGGAGVTPSSATAALTNGQLYFGRTGLAPIAGSIIAGSGISVDALDGAVRVSNSSSAPASARILRTAGNITTTSTSLVDLTGATIGLTTGANPAYLSFTSSASSATNGGTMVFNFDVDGAAQLGTAGIYSANALNGEVRAINISGMTDALSSGAHVFKVRWYVLSSTGTVYADGTNDYLFSAFEVK